MQLDSLYRWWFLSMVHPALLGKHDNFALTYIYVKWDLQIEWNTDIRMLYFSHLWIGELQVCVFDSTSNHLGAFAVYFNRYAPIFWRWWWWWGRRQGFCYNRPPNDNISTLDIEALCACYWIFNLWFLSRWKWEWCSTFKFTVAQQKYRTLKKMPQRPHFAVMFFKISSKI